MLWLYGGLTFYHQNLAIGDVWSFNGTIWTWRYPNDDSAANVNVPGFGTLGVAGGYPGSTAYASYWSNNGTLYFFGSGRK